MIFKGETPLFAVFTSLQQGPEASEMAATLQWQGCERGTGKCEWETCGGTPHGEISGLSGFPWGTTHTWMIYKCFMENPIEMDDLGAPPILGNIQMRKRWSFGLQKPGMKQLHCNLNLVLPHRLGGCKRDHERSQGDPAHACRGSGWQSIWQLTQPTMSVNGD